MSNGFSKLKQVEAAIVIISVFGNFVVLEIGLFNVHRWFASSYHRHSLQFCLFALCATLLAVSCCFENTPIKAVTVRLLLKLIRAGWHTSYGIQLDGAPHCNCSDFKKRKGFSCGASTFCSPDLFFCVCVSVCECVSGTGFHISSMSTP